MSNETGIQEVAQSNVEPTTNESTANIATEVTHYKVYGKYSVDKDGATKLDKVSVMGETKDGKNWVAAEADGLQLLAESDVKFYSVANEQGFIDLVPDADQRVYLINKGLASVQSAAVASNLKETDEAGNFVNSGKSVDLRDAINKAPERVVLSPEQKALKAFGALDAGAQARMLEALKSLMLQGVQ